MRGYLPSTPGRQNLEGSLPDLDRKLRLGGGVDVSIDFETHRMGKAEPEKGGGSGIDQEF